MPKDYVYACVCSQDKSRFLVARKKKKGDFFQGTMKESPADLNFSGQDVFPGGKLEYKYKNRVVDGAKTEFKEETGINILEHAQHVKDVKFPYYDEKEPRTLLGHYHAVWFFANDIDDLATVINSNLELSPAKKIQHVEDDELEHVTVYDKATALALLGEFKVNQAADDYIGQKDKSWFVSIMNDFK